MRHRAQNLRNETELWRKEYEAPGNGVSLWASKLLITEDARIVAGSSWGDDSGATPTGFVNDKPCVGSMASLALQGKRQTHGLPNYIVLGSESRGLTESLLAENTDSLVRIPMLPASTRSLNLSTAGALVLYEAVRQHHEGGPDLRRQPEQELAHHLAGMVVQVAGRHRCDRP